MPEIIFTEPPETGASPATSWVIFSACFLFSHAAFSLSATSFSWGVNSRLSAMLMFYECCLNKSHSSALQETKQCLYSGGKQI